ncbi:MAG: class I SAM-dependent methyltransferase [Betaproteobacteria bacterium]
MKNRDKWMPSKYVYRDRRLKGSRDGRELWVGSRLIADIVAAIYDQQLRRHSRGRLLDLGCGKAPLFIVYKDYASEVICADWANTTNRSEHLDLECDLTRELPFVANEFDTIILSDVLEHIPNPELLWSEISRVLNSNGKVLVNVPFFYWIHEAPHDYYRYTEYALRRFVDRAGLKMVELDAIGGAPEIMADLLAKNMLRVPRIGDPAARLVQWITSIFLATRLGKRISRSTAETFPYGYFLVAQKP